MTPERIDYHLDAVLKASGSALRHYSMAKTLDEMRAALRAAIDEAAAEAAIEAERDGGIA